MRLFTDDNIIMKRIVVDYEPTLNQTTVSKIEIDHIKMFRDYCRSNIGTSNIIEEELNHVCK